MRGIHFVVAALASLAAACGNHAHDQREWTADELAELEHKWGMEVSCPLVAPFFFFSFFFSILAVFDVWLVHGFRVVWVRKYVPSTATFPRDGWLVRTIALGHHHPRE